MKKYTTILMILILVISLTAGCSNSDDTKGPEKSFLWEISSESTTVYVLGSIHMASADLYPFADAIEDAYDISQNLAVEVDITGIDMEVSNMLLIKGKYPTGETLRDNISADLYEKVDEVLGELGWGIFIVNTFEPWVVTTTIEELQMTSFGYSSDYGIDTHFLNRAHEEGKDIIELESMEFQINLLDGFSDEIQILILEDVVENMATKKEIESLFDAWETGDVTAMENIALDDPSGNPELVPVNEAFLDERNFGMVDKIEDFLKDDETYFVVVGAAHLVGENGIINLLGEKGYSTEQL
ncbi:MAG: TraB/GumN family protein [Chloroflexi bacterium]|jgi:uncharacterized protein|nr:TraB/GumN family protein [Chloroflexota bacterium]